MSFSVEQCERDGWKCEVTNNKNEWEPAIYWGQWRDGSAMFVYDGDPEAKRLCAQKGAIRNLPPKPKEPTCDCAPPYITCSVGQGVPDKVTFVLNGVEMVLPWPFTPEHQRWMDRFDKVGDHSWCRLWTLIEEGWTFIPERTSAGYCFGNHHFQGSERTLTAAVEAAWKMRLDAPAK